MKLTKGDKIESMKLCDEGWGGQNLTNKFKINDSIAGYMKALYLRHGISALLSKYTHFPAAFKMVVIIGN